MRTYTVCQENPSIFTKFDAFLGATVVLLFITKIFTTTEATIRMVKFGIISCLVLLVLRFIYKMTSIKEESLSVIYDTGVQMETKYYSGRVRHRFLDKEMIKAVIINEGFILNQVIYYMAFIVYDTNDKTKMVLPFETLYPRFGPLLQIYRGTRAVMYGEQEEPSQTLASQESRRLSTVSTTSPQSSSDRRSVSSPSSASSSGSSFTVFQVPKRHNEQRRTSFPASPTMT
eukprot:GEZU01008852.1.p1 GENE.GEZU01008852.1~~GEZU01008852.1.p1  ORF type:complete len:264 (-),score=8.94 GEZU01008852.1:172-861(-)